MLLYETNTKVSKYKSKVLNENMYNKIFYYYSQDHKISLTTVVGYPLSKYISNKNSHCLSYAALEVACHALENYCDKMKNSQYNDLKVHAYRAALEMILIKKGGIAMKHGRVGSVKVRDQMTFVQ